MSNENEPKTRMRSPAYPSISLPVAVDAVRKLWDAQRKGELHIDSALKVLGYSSRNGAALRIIAALNHYGLIEENGSKDTRRIRLSEPAQDIIHLPESEPRRQKALREAALLPTIHFSLWERYGAQLPDDAAIRPFLVRDKNFNDAMVGTVIANYRSTLEFAKMDTPGDDNADVETVAPAPKSRGFADWPPVAPPPVAVTPKELSMTTLENELPVLVGNNRVARIPFPMAADDFDLLIETLTLWKKKIVRPEPEQSNPAKDMMFPRKAIWKNKDHDVPVEIVDISGEQDGVRYYKSSTGTGIPGNELFWE